MKKKFILTIVAFFICVCNGYALESSSIEEAIIETAQSYYRKGDNIQYDYYKKSFTLKAEDATDDHTMFSDCSSYVYRVYYNTLGISLPTLTKGWENYAARIDSNSTYNRYNTLVAYHKDSNIYGNDVFGAGGANIENYFKSLISSDQLKVGDVLLIRRTKDDNETAGHVMLVESIDKENGVAKILESNGTSYNTSTRVDKYEKSGSIKRSDLTSAFKNRYSSGLTVFAIFRIINDDNKYLDTSYAFSDYNLTEYGNLRKTYKGIDINKVSSSYDNSVVMPYDKITYTITINNNSSSDYTNLVVNEAFDKNLVEVVDAGDGEVSDGKITWKIDKLNASENMTITYTVKVINNKSNMGKYIISTGDVSGISSAKIVNYIGNRLTKKEQIALVTAYTKHKNESLGDREFIDKIYSEALGINVGLSSNNDFYSYVKFTDTKPNFDKGLDNKMYLLNYYGLRLNTTNSANSSSKLVPNYNWDNYTLDEYKDRVRDISFDQLELGDILLLYNENDSNMEFKAYVYTGDSFSRKVSDGIELQDKISFLQNALGDNFAILRPSLSVSKDYNEEELERDNLLNVDTDVNSKEDTKIVSADKNVDNPQTGPVYYVIGITILGIITGGFIYKKKKDVIKKI